MQTPREICIQMVLLSIEYTYTHIEIVTDNTQKKKSNDCPTAQ